jgi:hypothetical protein
MIAALHLSVADSLPPLAGGDGTSCVLRVLLDSYDDLKRCTRCSIVWCLRPPVALLDSRDYMLDRPDATPCL